MLSLKDCGHLCYEVGNLGYQIRSGICAYCHGYLGCSFCQARATHTAKDLQLYEHHVRHLLRSLYNDTDT
mgnify:CR=1 FL=1